MPIQEYPSGNGQLDIYPLPGSRYGSHPNGDAPVPPVDDILLIGGDALQDAGVDLKNG